MSFGLIKTLSTQCGERIFGVHPPARKTRGDGSGQTGVLCARGLENIPLKKKKRQKSVQQKGNGLNWQARLMRDVDSEVNRSGIARRGRKCVCVSMCGGDVWNM